MKPSQKTTKNTWGLMFFFFFCLIFSRQSRDISRQWFSCSFQLWVCSCSEHSCTKCTQYDSFTFSKHAHMLSCRALGGMHLSAITGSQTAWRRMQEQRECLFPTCCHAHKLHDDGSGRLASCWPRISQTATSSLLTSTLISCFLLVFSLSSPLCQCTLSCQLLDGQLLEYRGVCVKLIYISV